MTMGRRRFIDRSLRLAGGAVASLLLPGRLSGFLPRSGSYAERAVYAMGTTVSISAFGRSRKHVLESMSKAFEELYRLDRVLSVFRGESDVSRLNEAAGRREVIVDEATIDILRIAKRFHTVTDGRFDVTMESLMTAYGFRGSERRTLTSEDEEVAELRRSIGMHHLHVSGRRVFLENGKARVDLGGIGVGYTVDAMTDILRNEAIESALINHGGDIYALGAPPDAPGWPVLIEDPTRREAWTQTLELRDAALSTSSNARANREFNGYRMGHILDPRTGQSATGLDQVSILSSTSVCADALSTGFFNSYSIDDLKASFNRARFMHLDPGRCFAIPTGSSSGEWLS